MDCQMHYHFYYIALPFITMSHELSDLHKFFNQEYINTSFFVVTKSMFMKPLKIFFKIVNTGNGKFLSTKNEVNNLIVEVISKNPSQPTTKLREIALQEFQQSPAAQKVLKTNDFFFIDTITNIEVVITYLPQEKSLQEQFYTQWRYVQVSSPYRLIQYLDENRVVVYSNHTRVIHTIKLDKTITVHVDEAG